MRSFSSRCSRNSWVDGVDAALDLRGSPYPGLRPFDLDDSKFFFGRAAQVTALLDLLSSRAFVAVVGSSGSGKSSLVRAGLLPALQQSTYPRWTTWVMRPE